MGANPWKSFVIERVICLLMIRARFRSSDLPANTPVASATFPFDPNGGHGYVWHCHIVDHEDNEMMRPDEVVPNANAQRTYIKGQDC